MKNLKESMREDIPHKIASKRDIVLGTVEIKNGVLQVYTQKCEEFDC